MYFMKSFPTENIRCCASLGIFDGKLLINNQIGLFPICFSIRNKGVVIIYGLEGIANLNQSHSFFLSEPDNSPPVMKLL